MPRRKPPNRGGRPSKFTTDTAIALAAALAGGQNIEDAAAAGIGISSAYRWVALGTSGDPRFITLAALADKGRKTRHRPRFKRSRAADWRCCFAS